MSFFCKDEIRDLGEAVAGRKIGAHNFDVAFFEDVADRPHLGVVHIAQLYVTVAQDFFPITCYEPGASR